VEELHTNVTISLLAMDSLVYFTPVTAPDAEMTIYQNVFHYDKKALLLTYGLALLLGLLALVLGMKSLFQNGVSTDLGFLSILLTTRNKALDDLAWGACLGADPIPERLKSTSVKFGAISNEPFLHQNTDLIDKSGSCVKGAEFRNDLPHAAFAVGDGIKTLRDLQKGVIYV
jgi:hypothetical protein